MATFHNSFQIPDDATLETFNLGDIAHVTELPQPVSSRLIGIITDALNNPLKYRNSNFEVWVHNNDGFIPGNTGDGTFSVSLDGTVEGEEIHSYSIEKTDKQDYNVLVYDLLEIPIKYSGSVHKFTTKDGWIFRAVIESSAIRSSQPILKTLVENASAIEWAPSFTVEDIKFFSDILKQEVADHL